MQGGESDDDVPLFQFPNDDDVPLFPNGWAMKRKREEEAELRLRSEAAIAQRNNLGNEKLKLATQVRHLKFDLMQSIAVI